MAFSTASAISVRTLKVAPSIFGGRVAFFVLFYCAVSGILMSDAYPAVLVVLLEISLEICFFLEGLR